MLVTILQKEFVLTTQFSVNSMQICSLIFGSLVITVYVQIDHLPPYHLILIVCEFCNRKICLVS